MALTYSNFKRMVPMRGGWKCGYVDITFDDSYPTGGYAIAAADLDVPNIYTLFLPGAVVAASNLGFVPTYDKATGKLVVYESGTADAGLDELNDTSAALDGLTITAHYVGY